MFHSLGFPLHPGAFSSNSPIYFSIAFSLLTSAPTDFHAMNLALFVTWSLLGVLPLQGPSDAYLKSP